MRGGALRSIVLSCALFALGGCFGGGAPPRYYTLGALPTAGGGAGAGLAGTGVYVGPVDFPRYLDRPEIVVRDGAHGLVLSESNRWAGSFRSDFTRVLADRLAARIGTERVVTYPNEARFPIDYRVQIELVSFDGAPGANVSLRARWVIAAGSNGAALAAEESELSEPTASASWDDLIAAHGRLLDTFSGAIADRIAALATRPTAR